MVHQFACGRCGIMTARTGFTICHQCETDRPELAAELDAADSILAELRGARAAFKAADDARAKAKEAYEETLVMRARALAAYNAVESRAPLWARRAVLPHAYERTEGA